MHRKEFSEISSLGPAFHSIAKLIVYLGKEDFHIFLYAHERTIEASKFLAKLFNLEIIYTSVLWHQLGRTRLRGNPEMQVRL